MAETYKERYYRRKKSGKCLRCGKQRDREGVYCSDCLEPRRIYMRENREFFKKNHLCATCGREKVYGDDRTCFTCRARVEERRKPLTDEQKKRYSEHFSLQQKALRQQRAEQGLCTRCGRIKAIEGKKKCGVCLAKDAEIHRRTRDGKVNTKEYRKNNYLCYYCGQPIDVERGQTCSTCLNKIIARAQGRTNKNPTWKRDNNFVFKN